MNWRFNGYMPMQSTVNPEPPLPPTSGSNAQKATQDKREIGMRGEKDGRQITAKEAIEYLKNAQIYMARSTGMSANCPLYKAFMLAISALDRRMPRKVKISLKGTTDWNTKYHCPNCGAFISNGKYCRECGQALDWSDV